MPPSTASRQRRSLTALVSVSALGLAACGGAGHAETPSTSKVAPMHAMSSMPDPPPGAPIAGNAVVIDNFAFNPPAITLKAGTTVTWTNKDEEPHSVVLGQEGRLPVLVGNTATYSHTFVKPGTYAYNCGIHPFMHGTV